MIKTIGFFGDSYCAVDAGWIRSIADHYSADITHLGKPGSSIADLIINQWNKQVQRGQTPDIAVFVWTTDSRLFHPQVRSITPEKALSIREKQGNKDVWSAAKDYYMHLYDPTYMELLATSLMCYFDRMVLPLLPNLKIVHMWAFGQPIPNRKNDLPEGIRYPYEFTSGVELRPALVTISQQGRTQEQMGQDDSPNHMETEAKNTHMFNLVRAAIEQQQHD
jgi:hypothetical protein